MMQTTQTAGAAITREPDWWWLMDRTDPEWDAMWAGLFSWDRLVNGYDEPATVANDALQGESWQYMGTVTRDSETIGRREREGRAEFFHQFRHRWHPTLERKVYVNWPATQGWRPLAR